MAEPRLHVEYCGDSSAPDILLLHGFMGCAADWAPVAEELARDYHVMMVDLPGHGRSVGLPDSCYSWQGVVRALQACVSDAGGALKLLAGYSMGGRIALHTLMTGAVPADRVCIISAQPGLAPECVPARRELEQQWIERLRTELLDSFLHDWYRQSLFAAGDEEADQWIRRRRTNDPEELIKALRGFSVTAQTNYWPQLADLNIPLLSIAGEKDAKYVEVTGQMQALNRKISSHILAHAGHAVHLQQAAALTETLVEFTGETS